MCRCRPARRSAQAFIQASAGVDASIGEFSDFDAPELAALTAGISLTDLNVLMQSARESGTPARCAGRSGR